MKASFKSYKKNVSSIEEQCKKKLSFPDSDVCIFM